MKRNYIPEILIVEEDERFKEIISRILSGFAGVIFVKNNSCVIQKLMEHGPCNMIILSYVPEEFKNEKEELVSKILELSPSARIEMFVPIKPNCRGVTKTSILKMVKSISI